MQLLYAKKTKYKQADEYEINRQFAVCFGPKTKKKCVNEMAVESIITTATKPIFYSKVEIKKIHCLAIYVLIPSSLS